jgi:hypothetical protein
VVLVEVACSQVQGDQLGLVEDPDFPEDGWKINKLCIKKQNHLGFFGRRLGDK